MRTINNHNRQSLFPILAAIVATSSSIQIAAANPVDPLGYTEALDFFSVFNEKDQKDVTCPSNYFSCESQGPAFEGTCCENGQVCSLDAASSAACCPQTATCTGVAPTTTVTTASYVSNSYFQFPIVAYSFSNAAACTAAVSDCASNYNACVSELVSGAGSGGYGVTVSVPGGGGTTVAPATTSFASATATSICSSLSLSGCHGLSDGLCKAGTQDGITVGSANWGPRITPAPRMVAGVAAGVGLGIMGAGGL
ncbi:hypothetical protein F5Y16DRAFT_378429 [Xylariaceae sp. FL0255]|nr:hypothetical protein F5Y16DRAFT_378429 [Xylariaceae sp. FL0255]